MRISLDIRKSVGENAASYFEKAKKEKKKIEGARKVVADYRKKLSILEEEHVEKKAVIKAQIKKEWYEKFRWFISSEGFLVIGGRDSTTNELVIKKHTNPNDVVFHTDMPGSPFVVVKRERVAGLAGAAGDAGAFPESTLEEAAIFTAVFSRGWKQGIGGLSVFSVKPEQVSKTARSGEFIAKGAFMIYGEKKFYRTDMSYAVGVWDDKILGGPLSAVKKHCKDFVEIIQGDEKLSDVAKQIQKKLGKGLDELDDIIRVLPANCRLKRQA
jgi:predicted ribosome quality control (RQC) complex YloA/Tae2 family protein